MPGTTPIYGFPFQVDGDPADGPALGEDLALAVETLLSHRKELVDQRTTASSAISGTTLVAVMTVTLPVAGTYVFGVKIVGTQNSANGRPAFAVGGTATATAWRWASSAAAYNAGNAQGAAANGTTFPGSTSGTAVTNTDWVFTAGYAHIDVEGTVTVSAAGTLTFRISSSTTGTFTVREGSIAHARLVL